MAPLGFAGPVSQQIQEGEMGEGPAKVGARRRPKSRVRSYSVVAAAVVAGVGLAIGATVSSANAAPSAAAAPVADSASSWVIGPPTATPIKHVVVIFDENISFDHYFGTYPFAANLDGNPFHAAPGTPKVNGLYRSINSSGPTGPLLTNNPNLGNPTRLTYTQALTCDQDHGYTAEQQAFNNGNMDKFVQFTNNSSCSPPNYSAPNLVMD
jgi:phospholipase C